MFLLMLFKYSLKTLIKTRILVRRYVEEALRRTFEFRRDLPDDLKSKKVITDYKKFKENKWNGQVN